jgi:hypothetical protein
VVEKWRFGEQVQILFVLSGILLCFHGSHCQYLRMEKEAIAATANRLVIFALELR